MIELNNKFVSQIMDSEMLMPIASLPMIEEILILGAKLWIDDNTLTENTDISLVVPRFLPAASKYYAVMLFGSIGLQEIKNYEYHAEGVDEIVIAARLWNEQDEDNPPNLVNYDNE